MISNNVWRKINKSQIPDDRRLLGSKWVFKRKKNGVFRARLVAREVASDKADDCFASTPHIEAKRLLLSHMATRRRRVDGRAPGASFIDFKRAWEGNHFVMKGKRLRYCFWQELIFGA